MDMRQVAAALVLKQLGIALKLDQFNDRLVIQKALYLAQASDVKLGYFFSWYIRGPYCSTVAKDLFAALENPTRVKLELSKYALDAESNNRLISLRPLLKSSLPNLSQPMWLELLASVHYLLSTKPQREPNEKEFSDELKGLGKNFSPPQVKCALVELTKHGLIKTATCS